jgi:hypothetical protein
VPKGLGKALAVRVQHCSCSPDKEAAERRTLDARAAERQEVRLTPILAY